MYDLDPVVDLASVKDDLTNTRSGFSFVKHPDNGLVDAYLDLSVKACTTRRKGLSTALSFAQPRIAQPRLSCSFLLLAYDILRQPSLLLAYRIVHPSLSSGVG
jgi:hypothetical protein